MARRGRSPRGGALKKAVGNGRAESKAGFTWRVKAVLRAIPRGRVTSYGQVAVLAGSPGGSRQVVRILHTCAGPEKLPWHRVLRKNGEIALPPGRGGEEQRALLEDEGVEFMANDCVDMESYGWRPRKAIRVPREVKVAKRA